MLERSPISYADKSRTPLLILDGKEDPRVHPSQSLVMYRYMKVLSKAPVRLVLYPGEGHGNRFAAHRLDYDLRMIQWMEHYLKGPGGEPPPYEIEYEATGGKSP
jgi:dipeptidyl aminopeptidase/acylaminoacyl peptidase